MPASQAPPFGLLLKRFRLAAGLTQEDLAERALVSARGISDLERGVNRAARRDTIRQLAEALQLDVDERAALEDAAHTWNAHSSRAVQREKEDVLALGIFMFIDMRGYTRFTQERGDEAAGELAVHFAGRVRAGMDEWNGQLVELRGDEALCVFNSARQAVNAALGLQRLFDREVQSDPAVPLPVGIGLDAGEAVRVEGGYRGGALNLAARLCALAGPGEVLLSETVAQLARKIEGVTYVERGAVELKGFADPVRVVEVTVESGPVAGRSAAGGLLPAPLEGRFPIGNFIGALPRGPLIARHDEMERLVSGVEAVTAGEGRLILLVGEAGVGKTRLAQEIFLLARNHSFLVATGPCHEAERLSPYYPFLEVLSGAYQAAPADIRSHVARRWPHLARLLPDPSISPPTVARDDREEHLRLGRAVTSFFQSVAKAQPVAIVFDDLQWADELSLDLLGYLARHTRADRVLLVCTCVDSAVHHDTSLSALLRNLGRERLLERVPVRRLIPEGTAELVAAIMGEMEASEEFAAFVHRKTRGIPALIDEMLRSLGGRYQLVRELGAGGMGRVFQAKDVTNGKSVAAKIMFARGEVDLENSLRFQQEGAVLAALNHPNIVDVYGTFVEEHASWIIMELLDGWPLGQLMSAEAMSLRRIKHLATQVASALGYAHSHRIVHRDVKPDNIMVLHDDRVKVTDFGIARILRPDMTLDTMASTGMTMGTPLYMAPEQIEGHKIDGRADLYSLGAVLYQMVTGCPPFDGPDPLSIALKHVSEPPPPPRSIDSAVPEDWERLILRCLAKDPAARFQSADDLQDAMEALTSAARPPAQGSLPMASPHIHKARETATGTHDAQVPADPDRSYLLQVQIPDQAPAALLAGVPARIEVGGARLLLDRVGKMRVRLLTAAALGAMLAAAIVWIGNSSGPAAPPRARRAAVLWGTSNTSIVKFQNPDGIALDGENNIYVADQLSDTVQEISPRGEILASWGGSSHLVGPAGLAVDSEGNVYVADTGNSRIVKFSHDGRVLATMGEGEFASPLGIALDSDKNIYVTDAGNGQLVKLSAGGRILHRWGSKGGGAEQFQYPYGVALDSHGNIYVADDGRIQEVTPTGRFVRRTFKPETAHAGSGAFSGIALDATGDVFVADQVNDTVRKFSPDGRFLMSLGTKGSGPGQLQSPQGLSIDAHGNIFVADSQNHRVQELSAVGTPLEAWKSTGGSRGPRTVPGGIAVDVRGDVFVADTINSGSIYKLVASGRQDPRWQPVGYGEGVYQFGGLATDRNGNVYVADQLNDRVIKLSPTGKLLAGFDSLHAPSAVALDARGNLYVADAGDDSIVELSSSGKRLHVWGSPGNGEVQFASPVGIAVDGSGNIYVVDSVNDDVQKLTSGGVFVLRLGRSGPERMKSPSAVATDSSGNVYVADTGHNRIEEFSVDGKMLEAWGKRGSAVGQFNNPQGIAIDDRGTVYVADTDNHRVQTLSPVGQ